LYSSPNTVRQIKSRQMRLAGHVACTGRERKVCKVLLESPKEEITRKTEAQIVRRDQNGC
jgi:hypothetical protein